MHNMPDTLTEINTYKKDLYAPDTKKVWSQILQFCHLFTEIQITLNIKSDQDEVKERYGEERRVDEMQE